MERLFISTCILGAIFASQIIRAQTPPANTQSGSSSQQTDQKTKSEGQSSPGRFESDVRPPLISPSITTGNFFSIKPQFSKEQKKRLLPHAEDKQIYHAFLQQPDTGLIRLFLDRNCQTFFLISAEEHCLDYIPGSSFYSFREKEHTIENLADIRLKNGFLISDGTLSQGMLVKLGDREIHSVTVNDSGIKFLQDFKPEAYSRDALNQYLELVNGVKEGEFFYRKSLPASPNTTYAMRVVAYRGSYWRRYRGFVFNMLAGDDRKDLILVFRVLRRDYDGSISLLWKILERRKAPKVVFPKKNDRTADASQAARDGAAR